MFSSESLYKSFIRGLSFLDSYIKLNNKTHLQDINIVSEQFFCHILNILYGWELVNANTSSRQAPGYDLISQKDKIIIQVTSQCTKAKILDCFEKLVAFRAHRASLEWHLHTLEKKADADTIELQKLRSQLDSLPDLTGYELRFLFLTADTGNLRKNTERVRKVPSWIRFDPTGSILDFAVLSRSVQEHCVYGPSREKLESFIQMHPDLFNQNIPSEDHVQEIIDEYAENYQSKLFLHRYQSSSVTLQNLYVEPAYRDLFGNGIFSRNVPELLCDFLWQRPENDNERMLFIEGDAAIGKTSLVSWLCHHYCLVSQNKEDQIAKAIFLNRKAVCIRMRELELNQGGSAKDAVLRYLKIDSLRSFRARYPQAILILDGADELSMVTGSSVQTTEEFLLELQRTFHDHKFIITTRPKFLNLSHEDFHRSAFKIRRVELLHYNKEMRSQWLENYKHCGESVSPATEQYITSLSDALAEGVADTPLALYLLVRCDMREELQGNSWALYREIFSAAIAKGEYNLNFDENSILMDTNTAQTNYSVVQNIAFRMFCNAREDRYYLNTGEIDEVISQSKLNGLTKDQVRSTCVLCAYWKNTATLGALEFYHNNIRDFFLCEYISDSLIRCIRVHNEQELFDALIAEFCRLLCWGDISGTTWEQAFTFLRLRLWYEKDHPQSGTLYAVLRQVKNLPNVIWHLSVNKQLWCHPSPDLPYVSARRVFANAMMLMRILMDTEPGMVRHCIDADQQRFWSESGLFRDWCRILSQSVWHSDQQIGLATRTWWENLDWSGCSLKNANFSHGILTNVIFKDTVLECTSFRNTKLVFCQFQNVRMRSTDFRGAVLETVTLWYPDLKAISPDHSLQNSEKVLLGNNRFTDSTVTGLEVEGFRLNSMHFSGTRLNNCRFSNSTFSAMRVVEDSAFASVNFYNVSFSCIFDKSQFRQCQFHGGQFLSGSKVSSEFVDTEFTNVQWSGSLFSARFVRCNFNNCDFSGLDQLRNVLFEDCQLESGIFRRLHLVGVQFHNVNLRNAVFSRARLDACIISGFKTDLQDTNFVEAKNRNSRFSGIDLSRAKLQRSEGFEEYASTSL